MKKIFFAFTAFTLLTFAACKKDDDIITNPDPVEPELITTVRLHVTGDNGFDKTFNYKVENGFGGTTPGTITKDSVILEPNKTYNVEIFVLNEKETPAEDITEEVKEESNDHLFVLQSDPVSGAGSIQFSDGSKDANGDPLNQTIKFSTGAAGTGLLAVILKHEPTDKNANSPIDAGGETDAQAVFNVVLR